MKAKRKTKSTTLRRASARQKSGGRTKAADNDPLQLRKALRTSERRFRHFLDSVEDGILMLNVSTGEITDVNHSLVKLLKCPAKELQGKKLWQLTCFKNVAATKKAFKTLQEKKCIRYENVSLALKDGGTINVEFVSNVYQVDGKPVIQCNVRDITQRKRAGEEIAWLASFPARNPNPVIEVDSSGTVCYMNPAAQRMFPELPVSTFSHPWLAGLDTVIAEFKSQGAGSLRREVEIGDTWYAQLIYCMPEGERLHVYGNDITERKRAEEQLAYQARLLAEVHDAIVATDENYRLAAWNASAEKLYGWKAEEVLGRNGLEIVRTEWSGVDGEEMRRTIAEIGRWRGEATQARKDGTRFPAELSSIVLRDENGRITGWLSVNRDITERKLAEEALRESEERYRQLVEGSPDAIAIHSEGRFVYVNPAGVRLLGARNADELIGTPILDVVHPESRQAVVKRIAEMKKGKEAPLMEERFLKRDGTTIDVEVTSLPITYRGTPAAQVIVRDITERKRMEDALRRSEEWHRAIFSGSRDAIFIADEHARFVDVNEAAISLTGYSRNELLGMSIPQLHEETDLHAYERYFGRILDGEPIESEAKLLRKDATKTDTEFSNKRIEIGGIPYMHTIARDMTGRRHVEEALRESGERLKLTLDAVNDGVWDWNIPSGKTVYSPRYYTMLGYEPFEFPETYDSWKRMVHPDDIEKAELDMNKHMKSGQAYIKEIRMLGKSGEWIWILARGKVVEWDQDGNAVRMVGTHTDITERKLAEDALRTSERQFRLVWETSGDGMRLTDGNGTMVAVNDAFCRIVGKRREELEGKPLGDVYEESRREHIRDQHRKRFVSRTVEPHLERKMILWNGQARWFEVSNSFFEVGGGKQLLLGVFRDITERKRAEEALVQSEKRYREVVENAAEIIYTTDIRGRFTHSNAAGLKVSGYTLEELTQLSAFDLVPPEEHRALIKCYFNQFKSKNLVAYLEYSFKTRSGEVLWLAQSTSLVYENENIVGFHVIARDITERKRTEDALKESEKKFKTLADQSPNMIFINCEGRIVYVNNRCEKMMGYSKKELLAPSFDFRSLIAEESVQIVNESFEKHRQGQETPPIEYAVRTRNGRIMETILSTSLIDYEGGKAILGIVTDLSEHKRAEANLRESELRYRTLFEDSAVAIWEEDFSEVKKFLEQLRASGIHDLRSYLESHRDVVERCATLVKVIDVNKEAMRFVRPSGKEKFVRNLPSYFGEESWPIFAEELVAVAEGQTRFESEIPVRTPDGAQKNLLLKMSVAPYCEKTLERVLVSFIDITDRKFAEELSRVAQEELRATNRKLERAQRIAHIGSWENYLPTQELNWSEEMYRIMGFPLNAPVSVREVAKCFPSVEFGRFTASVQAAIAGQKPYSMDYKYIRPDGAKRYIHDEGEVIRDEQGNALWMVGATYDITERMTIEEEIRGSNKRLRELANHLQTIREEERKHISQEFHDQLGQTLTAIKMDLAMFERLLEDKTSAISSEALHESVKGIQGLVDRAVHSVREIMSELRPELLDQLGLLAAIEWEGEKFQRRSGVLCTVKSNAADLQLDMERSIAVFRIFQEATTNVARHAHATRVDVSMTIEQDDLVLAIKDDGVGIEDGVEDYYGSFGLVGMRERALLLRGWLQIKGEKGLGTTIILRIPLVQTFTDGGESR